ncbi:hypothetical protein Tco_0051662 [Tanacetum coccineum]
MGSTKVNEKPVVESGYQTSKNPVTLGPVSEPVHGSTDSTGMVNSAFKTLLLLNRDTWSYGNPLQKVSKICEIAKRHDIDNESGKWISLLIWRADKSLLTSDRIRLMENYRSRMTVLSVVIPRVNLQAQRSAKDFMLEAKNISSIDLLTERTNRLSTDISYIPNELEVNFGAINPEEAIRKKGKTFFGNLESNNTCSFMRTEESMKEWKKAKASLTTSLKKKIG